MKISFLIPPVLKGRRNPERVFGCNYGLYPIPNIFILQSAAVLEKEGCNVKFIDAPIMGWKEKDYVTFLEKDDSDIYLFYSVNLSIETDLLARKMIIDQKGHKPTIFFGPAPTYEPETFLKDEKCFVVRGEPEITLVELVKAISRSGELASVQGISYLDNERRRDNKMRELVEDIDLLPFPARHLACRQKYYNPKFGLRPFTAMLTSRGCPYRCLFCVPCSLSFAIEIEYKRFYNKKPPIRKRSVRNIVEEFEILAKDGYRTVSILDDQFLWEEERTLEICERIKDLGVKWGCLARADRITEKALKAMSEANCQFVDIGVESFDPQVLKYVRKDIDVGAIIKAIKRVKDHGIMVKLNLLIGSSPLETEESVLKNIEMVKRLRPDAVMFSICNPFPGTEFYDLAKKEGWFVKGDYYPVDVQKEAVVSYPILKKRDLERLARHANFSFYLNPLFAWRNYKRLFHPVEFVAALKALWRKLF